VPDPYYGDQRDFESTLAIIERSVDGLLEVLSRHLATDT
jgi:protein-tyrosine-phosphatase